MRDAFLCYDPDADNEPPICDDCGEFLETEIHGEWTQHGRPSRSGFSTTCANPECPSNQPKP